MEADVELVKSFTPVLGTGDQRYKTDEFSEKFQTGGGEGTFSIQKKIILQILDPYTNLTDSNVGGRLGRGIQDNLFAISAIINSVKTEVKMHVTSKCLM